MNFEGRAVRRAEMALADKVEKLQQDAATTAERLDNVLKALDKSYIAQEETACNLSALRVEYEREIALLKRDAEDHKKWKDYYQQQHEEHARRLWAFGPNVFGALITGFISAVVAYFVARR